MGSHGQIPLLLLPVACLAAVRLFSLLCSIPYHFFFFFLINRYLRSVQVFALTKLYCWEHSSTSLQTNTSNTLPKVRLLVVKHISNVISMPMGLPKHLCQLTLPPAEQNYFLYCSSETILHMMRLIIFK